MNLETARAFVLQQTDPSAADQTFLGRLRLGEPPLPGQITSLLLALKVIFEELRGQPQLDRTLIWALYALATEAPACVQRGSQAGSRWPPLLMDDLARLRAAAESILSDQWREVSSEQWRQSAQA